MEQNFIIENEINGKEIVNTSYYTFPISERVYFLSYNAEAFRLLIPTDKNDIMRKEMSLITEVHFLFDDDEIHILLEDHSTNPFQIHLPYVLSERITHGKRATKFIAYIYEDNEFQKLCEFPVKLTKGIE